MEHSMNLTYSYIIYDRRKSLHLPFWDDEMNRQEQRRKRKVKPFLYMIEKKGILASRPYLTGPCCHIL